MRWTPPLVELVFGAGPNDRVYDGLLLVAPAILVLVAVAGRSVATVVLVVAYLLVLVAYVLYRGVR